MTDEGSQGYFEQHQEQAFILKAFAMIFLIITFKEFLSGLFLLAFIFFPLFFLLYVRYKASRDGVSTWEAMKEHITLMPMMYTADERKKEGVAWVTYVLILINLIIFYGFEMNPFLPEEFIGDNLIFIPLKPNVWNVPVSAFSSMFLHANGFHLWGNMIFLWIVGTVTEKRMGYDKFILAYFITGVIANIVFVLMHFVFLGEVGHALGASGAIAGIMGIFAVRCYFKSMVFPLPILGIFSLILPVSLKIRLNSLVIMGLFFLADLGGGIGQVTGKQLTSVAHWAHIGGMVSGILLAWKLGLQKAAVEERHMDLGMKTFEDGMGNASEQSLKIVLDKNPDNPDALLYMARIKSKYSATEEGKEYYRRALQQLVTARPNDAAAVYIEYLKTYLQGLDPVLEYRMAGVFYRQKDFDTTIHCLEFVIQGKAVSKQLLERAIYQCAMLLEQQGNTEAARHYYELFVNKFPEAPSVPKIKEKLGIR